MKDLVSKKYMESDRGRHCPVHAHEYTFTHTTHILGSNEATWVLN